MGTTIINISKNDLFEYLYTLTNRNEIRKARMKIFNSMPPEIKNEYKTTTNDLVCIDENKGLYKTVAQKGSLKLQRYLDQFIYQVSVNEKRSFEKKELIFKSNL